MLKIQEFSRKTFTVEAVEVTEENLKEVAQWCGGRVKMNGGDPYVHVPVRKPANPNKPANPFKAFVGYKVLKSGEKSFRVYSPTGFEAAFELVRR